jgi:flagellar secretion chaperone FliS
MNATLEYRRNAVMTAPPEKLVVMMYDGAIRYTRQAIQQMEARNIGECGRLIGCAFSVVSELKVSLDPHAGGAAGAKLSGELERLYGFVMDELVKANRERKPEILQGALDVLVTLREGWNTVAQSN